MYSNSSLPISVCADSLFLYILYFGVSPNSKYLNTDTDDVEDADSSSDLYSVLFGGSGSGEGEEEQERELILDLNMEEVNQLLSQIANSRKNENENGEYEESQIFALKFVVESDLEEGTEPDVDDDDPINVDEGVQELD